jgi:hypothetical protein
LALLTGAPLWRHYMLKAIASHRKNPLQDTVAELESKLETRNTNYLDTFTLYQHFYYKYLLAVEALKGVGLWDEVKSGFEREVDEG